MENKNNLLSHENEASSSSSPYAPGYRFKPTDQELIIEYLTRKVNNQPIPIADMNEVNLYEHSPQSLAVNYRQLGDKEWYFFTPRDRKYPNGNRPNRAVGEVGFWKATGADKPIKSNNGKKIGGKKVLVFYIGKPKPNAATKTDWIMHEYKHKAPSKSPSRGDMRLDDWVLCRIYEKPKRSNKKRRRDVKEDVVENNVALNIHNNNKNAINQSQLIIHNNNVIDQSQLIVHNNNNAFDQNQLIVHNNNNAIDQSQLIVHNNNAIDQSQLIIHNNAIDQSHADYQSNYYYRGGFDQVLSGNIMNVGTSQDINFDYGFDYGISMYDQQYQLPWWGDYGVGNQGTNDYANGDLKKIVDDFIRDHEVPDDCKQPEPKRQKN